MRVDGRRPDELRPHTFETGVNRYAEGSCLVSMGHTRVLCTASVSEDVPRWLRDSGKGWVTAEYRMLPRATHTRSRREGIPPKGRTSEIQRLIGRSLRAGVNMDALGPVLIEVDCDVLQADGGTRTASINGAFVALVQALHGLHAAGRITTLPLLHTIAAVSAGRIKGQALLDLQYTEDAGAEVDLNVVTTGNGLVVEVQGCAEGKPFSLDELNELMELGQRGNAAITAAQLKALEPLNIEGRLNKLAGLTQ